MTELDRVLSLVERAINDFDDPAVPTSATLRRALRIANLRSDAANLIWLELESMDLSTGRGEASATKSRVAELAGHFERDEWARVGNEAISAFFARRRVASFGENIFGGSIEELEHKIAELENQKSQLVAPAGLHPVDLYFRSEQYDKVRVEVGSHVLELRQVLSRVRSRLYAFLIESERQLSFGQVNADVFERNRTFVDSQLAAISTEALEQFQMAYKRVREGDPESLSHALTSCRRLLKTLADAVYPATNAAVQGNDGRERKLTEDRYINRLLQFVSDQIGSHGSGEVIQTVLDGLGARLNALDDLASKGVHAKVSAEEVDVCVIQTYLVVGDILRIRSGQSAAPDAVRLGLVAD